MNKQQEGTSGQGAEWRRWDPHLHAPGTLLADQFGGDWEAYLTKIEQATPVIEVLGVTDYFSIGTYQEVVRRIDEGRLAGVKLIFPNVEMRLDIKTAKKRAINLHLLFSPEDADHEAQIERVLTGLTFEFQRRKYRCIKSDLAALGRACTGKTLDERSALREGANQFKVNFDELRELYRSDGWMHRNCLVAIAGGSTDGAAGLQDDDSFKAFRTELESFADIIFSATPAQREFWLGKKVGADQAFIEKTYRSLKPCLHGSDAHREESVGAPDGDRYCWIKGDATFECLRQAVIEPEERVWIGAMPPATGLMSMTVSEVETSSTPWLTTPHIRLNPGLVAIIGARGSGKTALADILAAGAHSFGRLGGQSSFLIRASAPVNHLRGATVKLVWGDGSESSADLAPDTGSDEDDLGAEVAYLSQHFVEKLCSASGVATELRREMERVVFEATDATSRLGATAFDELSDMLLEPIRRRRSELKASITGFSEQVVREELLKEQLPSLKKRREEEIKAIESNKKQLQLLVPKGKEQRAQELGRVEQMVTTVEADIEQLARRRKLLEDLSKDTKQIIERTEPTRFADMRRRYAGTQLNEEEWGGFQLVFAGDPSGTITKRVTEISETIKRKSEVDPRNPPDMRKTPDAGWPLAALVTARDALRKEVGADLQKERRYGELQQPIARQEIAVRKLTEEIATAEGAETRRRGLVDARRIAYADVFSTLVDEEAELAALYAPLHGSLSSARGALSKLAFVVQRKVDIAKWVDQGERLIDLRKATKLRGHGALLEEAKKHLLEAWRAGSADVVAAAMDSFRREFQEDLRKARPSSVPADEHRAWVQNVAAWLYGTEHVRVAYAIEYDGVAIEQLSPGTRGIVLLLLYLAVDRNDQRPLIIDQPEENLDPNSVFTELVPHFREARKRRQIIVVTHNANLVVNTDADQVIVADAQRVSADSLPAIGYEWGSLENPAIRRRVCETLEGGERAFLERERRYRLRWN